MTTVDYCFDFISPYAYFAWFALEDLRSRPDVRLRCRPVLFAAMLSHWGQLGPAEVPPKRVNTWKQCFRHAADRGIPFECPAAHPFSPLTALRMVLAAGDDGERVIDAVFRAGWGEGIDLGDPVQLAAAVDAVGLDGAALIEGARDPAVKRALRDNTEALIALGGFGVPTFVVHGPGEPELFWGNDSMPWLLRHLDGDDPIDADKVAEMLARPSRHRPR